MKTILATLLLSIASVAYSQVSTADSGKRYYEAKPGAIVYDDGGRSLIEATDLNPKSLGGVEVSIKVEGAYWVLAQRIADNSWANLKPKGKPEENLWLLLGIPGDKYSVLVFVTGKSQPQVQTVTIPGTPEPQPDPPPPDPEPDPTPDPPPPSPAPIPVAGFRVMFLHESADVTKLPPAQQEIFVSPVVREYLNVKCVKGADNKTPEWRIFDDDVAFTRATVWEQAIKRPRASLPWIVISDGKTGFEGPLPANVDDALTLLRKYGGQ